jgi:hypothetical protein
MARCSPRWISQERNSPKRPGVIAQSRRGKAESANAILVLDVRTALSFGHRDELSPNALRRFRVTANHKSTKASEHVGRNCGHETFVQFR